MGDNSVKPLFDSHSQLVGWLDPGAPHLRHRHAVESVCLRWPRVVRRFQAVVRASPWNELSRPVRPRGCVEHRHGTIWHRSALDSFRAVDSLDALHAINTIYPVQAIDSFDAERRLVASQLRRVGGRVSG